MQDGDRRKKARCVGGKRAGKVRRTRRGGFFFFKQKTAYEMLRSLVGSEMCIRDSELCDHSFHGLGVGYDAVGLERTVDTAPELRVRTATKLLSTVQPAGPEARARSGSSSSHLSAEPLTVLMITYVLRSVSGAYRHARLCSAGSKGYCAIKELSLIHI
eukprot:TRINITY_DN52098_c0_g1_i1.p1 TRINITY_DN52098_c0_g1~~TRINITY_DN52098_c0_g1_i1.p1  ORF type:complete len:159 (-),score=27.93 TRINITY_DN52098_c0_g1_i1:108-584(-)